MCGFVAWGTVNILDTWKLARAYRNEPPAGKFRELADYLLAHDIRYARAGYWDAYIIDFLTRERVIVASTGKVRVMEYQQRVDDHLNEAVQIDRFPCTGGVRVEAWCITGPPIP